LTHQGNQEENFILLLLLCWGYIVTFTKVLTISHRWIYPLIILIYLPSLCYWNSFYRLHLSIYICVYTIFAPYSAFYIIFPHPTLSHYYQCLSQTCSFLLFSVFEKKRKKSGIFVCWIWIYIGFLVTFLHIYAL
jgi:hypothetical protein